MVFTYIELYFIDNLVMNLLILRLAAALRSINASLLRLCLFAAFGAVYACLSVALLPILQELPPKLMLCIAMAFALPYKTRRDLATNIISTLIAAFISGGIAVGLAYLLGGSISGNVLYADQPMRWILILILVVSMLPRAIRLILLRRNSAQELKFTLKHQGITIIGTAFIDTGNALTDPLSGKPVVVMFAPELSKYAVMPIPVQTAAGSSTLYGFAPDVLTAGDQNIPLSCIIALSKEPIKRALFPPCLALTSTEKDVVEM